MSEKSLTPAERLLETARRGELHHALMDEGIIVSRIGLGCLSTPMTGAEVDEFIAAVRHIEEQHS